MNLENLPQLLREEIKAEVDRQLEEKLPAIMRALGIREAPETEAGGGYVDALAVARFLGRDLSSPENIRKAKRHVYNLAAQNRIPSIRLSERTIKFDLAKVKKALNQQAA